MDNSSGYDSTDEDEVFARARSVPPQHHHQHQQRSISKSQEDMLNTNSSRHVSKLRAVSEADLLRDVSPDRHHRSRPQAHHHRPRSRTASRSNSRQHLDQADLSSSGEHHDIHHQLAGGGRLGGRNEPKLRHRTASQLSVARQREGLSYR